jgi:Raf kinase inhibitor-like YbhB/YbcL family protein
MELRRLMLATSAAIGCALLIAGCTGESSDGTPATPSTESALPAGDDKESAAGIAAMPESTLDEVDANAPAGAKEVVMDITSPRFEHEAEIPLEYTCDGADVSPPLQWAAGPQGTKSYALIMDDPDAPNRTWVHWVIWNIPEPKLTDVIPLEPTLENGIAQGTNSWGKIGYGGPCPPPPTGRHRYFFKIYALDTTLDFPPSTTKEQLLDAMEGHILAQGELMGTYARQ